MMAKQPSFLFIMGHMRSRSSLLNHIMISQSNVIGLGESNYVYEDVLRLYYMKLKALWKRKSLNFFGSIFVDQINHNRKTPNADVFKNKNLKVIVLVRKPDASIKSILELAEKYYSPMTEEEGNDYYRERLHYLKKLKSDMPDERCLVIDSEAMVNDSERTFKRVQNFLNLKQAPTSKYNTFSFTGTSGDPSPMIKKGFIVQTKDETTLGTTRFSEAYALYEELVTQH